MNDSISDAYRSTGQPNQARRNASGLSGTITLVIGLGCSLLSLGTSVSMVGMAFANILKSSHVDLFIMTTLYGCLPVSILGLCLLIAACVIKPGWKTALAILLAMLSVMAALVAVFFALLAGLGNTPI